MSALELVYIVGGVGAIAVMLWALARDALDLVDWARWTHAHYPSPEAPPLLSRGPYLVVLVVLVALWLGAAWLRGAG